MGARFSSLAACAAMLVACGGAAAPDPNGSAGGSSGSDSGSDPSNGAHDAGAVPGDVQCPVRALGNWCPWDGCLDSPQATCVAGQWVCPPSPLHDKPKPTCACGVASCGYGGSSLTWVCPACPDGGPDAAPGPADASAD